MINHSPALSALNLSTDFEMVRRLWTFSQSRAAGSLALFVNARGFESRLCFFVNPPLSPGICRAFFWDYERLLTN
jgi:hypothetical protein